MAKTVTLPDWAKHRETPEGRIPAVDVDADGMYEAWLAELKAHYAEHTPDEWKDADGKITKEWAGCLAELEAPTAYWLEVAYQCGKMELQIAMQTFAFEIRIHSTRVREPTAEAPDPPKKWAQKHAKPGRGAHKAAGGLSGGREAREHFKRLRGFIPS